jgi:hypothetical protein
MAEPRFASAQTGERFTVAASARQRAIAAAHQLALLPANSGNGFCSSRLRIAAVPLHDPRRRGDAGLIGGAPGSAGHHHAFGLVGPGLSAIAASAAAGGPGSFSGAEATTSSSQLAHRDVDGFLLSRKTFILTFLSTGVGHNNREIAGIFFLAVELSDHVADFHSLYPPDRL